MILSRTKQLLILVVLLPSLINAEPQQGGAYNTTTTPMIHELCGFTVTLLPGTSLTALDGHLTIAKGSIIIRGAGTLKANDQKLEITGPAVLTMASGKIKVLSTSLDAAASEYLLQEEKLLWTHDFHLLTDPIKNKKLKEKLKKDAGTFSSTGSLSIEAGAACLDTASGGGDAGPVIGGDQQIIIEKGEANLKVKLTFPGDKR